MHQKLYEAAKIKAAQDAEDAIQARKVKPGVTGMNRDSIHFLIQERLMRRAQEEGESLAQEEWRQNQAGPSQSPVAAQGMEQPLAPMGAAPSAAHAPNPQTAPAQPATVSPQEAPAAGASIPGKSMAFKRPFSLFGDDENAIENAAREDAWRIVQAEREAEAADDTPPGYNKILWKASKEVAEKKRKEKRAATDEWLKTYFEQRQAEEQAQAQETPNAPLNMPLNGSNENVQGMAQNGEIQVQAGASSEDGGVLVSEEASGVGLSSDAVQTYDKPAMTAEERTGIETEINALDSKVKEIDDLLSSLEQDRNNPVKMFVWLTRFQKQLEKEGLKEPYQPTPQDAFERLKELRQRYFDQADVMRGQIKAHDEEVQAIAQSILTTNEREDAFINAYGKLLYDAEKDLKAIAQEEQALIKMRDQMINGEIEYDTNALDLLWDELIERKKAALLAYDAVQAEQYSNLTFLLDRLGQEEGAERLLGYQPYQSILHENNMDGIVTEEQWQQYNELLETMNQQLAEKQKQLEILSGVSIYEDERKQLKTEIESLDKQIKLMTYDRIPFDPYFDIYSRPIEILRRNGEAAKQVSDEHKINSPHMIALAKRWINEDFSRDDYTMVQKYGTMTETEMNIFNYIWNIRGKKEAGKYLDLLDNTLIYRLREENNEKWIKLAKEQPKLQSIMSVFLIAGKIVGYFHTLNEAAQGRQANPYDYQYDAVAQQRAIRGTVMEDMGDAGQFIYSTMLDVADGFFTTAFTGPWAPLAVGLDTAADSAYDALQNGATSEQAFILSAMNGGMKALTEMINMDAFLDKLGGDAGKNIAWTFMKEALGEGIKESINALTEPIFDNYIMEKRSRWNLEKTAYQDLTKCSNEEAERYMREQTVKEYLALLGSTAISSFINAEY